MSATKDKTINIRMTKTINIRMTKTERRRFQAAADKEGVSLSEWIRRACEIDRTESN